MTGKSDQATNSTLSDSIQNVNELEDQQPNMDTEIDNDDNTEGNDEEDHGEKKSKAGGGFTGKGLTLQMLLEDSILQPKEGAMSLEYMGQKFNGDLLPDGKIFSAEVQEVFSSPSAWALRCKRIVNPDQRYGCGWSSVRYCGRPLDVYKNQWMKKKRLENVSVNDDSEVFTDPAPIEDSEILQTNGEYLDSDTRLINKYESLSSRANIENPSQLVETVSFSSVGKLQPFLLSITSSALIVIEVHSMLTHSEVAGYLAGSWDSTSNTLTIRQAFPCLSQSEDGHHGLLTEARIAQKIESVGLILVGWYHSHVFSPPTPTVQDIDIQLEYQLKLKGNGDQGYRPCVAFISAPLYSGNASSCSKPTSCFWVSPPAESRPTELGRPMMMQYTTLKEIHFEDVLPKLTDCTSFYKNLPEAVSFDDMWSDELTYLERTRSLMISHASNPTEENKLIEFIQKMSHS